MEEREGVFNFFVDKSKSMDYGNENKKDTALKVVAALSYIALNNLDRVNISTMDNGDIQSIKSAAGKQSLSKDIKRVRKY